MSTGPDSSSDPTPAQGDKPVAAGHHPGPGEEELTRMSFGDHLDELRRRLLRAMGAVVVAIVCLMPFKEAVQEVILGPYRALWRATYIDYVARLEAMAASGPMDSQGREYLEWNREWQDVLLAGGEGFTWYDAIRSKGGFQMPYELVAISGLQDIWTFMAASLVFALCIASPVVLWQAWAFVAAGLYKHERKVVYRHLPLAVVLLVSGILFGYFVVVPYGLYFLVRLMNPGQVTPMLSVSDYFTLLFALTAALGAVFQLPMAMLAISKVGLVTYSGYVKHWRGIILGMWIVAALVTPPDPVTQSLMAGPLVLLFGLGLILVKGAERKKATSAAAPATPSGPSGNGGAP